MPAPRTRSGQLENAGLDGEKRNSHASATGVDIGGKRRTSTFEEEATVVTPLETAKDLVVDVIRLEDDPRTPALTFRMWFMGIGLSTFGATLATVYYFKPQAVFVSVIFLALISYITGEALAFIIPSKGWVGKWFDPHPFNKKEHAAIVIMASAAVSTPLATEVLAAQRLYYNQTLNAGLSIFPILSSQMLEYGIAGLMRDTLVYPTKMLWPVNLPMASLLDNLHGDKKETSSRLKLFYWVFAGIFIWEAFPEYIMPVTTGLSVFCLANRKSLASTNLFGGSNGNEGLGFLSFCLNWQYIGEFGDALRKNLANRPQQAQLE